MYVNQTELGTLFGVSSHVIGRWLVEIGLRTADKQPSPAAFRGGYLEKSGLENGGYFYKWHRAKTVAALEQAGHQQIAQMSAGRLNGPFTARQSSVNGYQIVNGDGTVSTWNMGKENARDLSCLMNLAYKHGWFRGDQ